MNRKWKIVLAAASILFIAIAISLIPANKPAALTITYSGTVKNDSNIVSFTLTNATRDTVVSFIQLSVGTNRSAADRIVESFPGEGRRVWLEGSISNQTRVLRLFSQTNLDFHVPMSDPWRLRAESTRYPLPSGFNRLRYKLAHWAYNYRQLRLGMWLSPVKEPEFTYGPEMLGNKPLAEAQK
jgi:hypothetical protein